MYTFLCQPVQNLSWCNICCCLAGRELLTTYEKVHKGFWNVMRTNLHQANYISTQMQQSKVRAGVGCGHSLRMCRLGGCGVCSNGRVQ